MDKQELRQDPIREKIIGSLSYLENNRNALFGVLAAIVLIIGVSGYYSSSSKALQVESASDLGVALITFTNDKDSGLMLLSKVLDEGDDASKQVAMATLVNHFYSNDQFFEVDSLLNLGVKITDNVISSKLLSLRGDMRANDGDYELALEAYSSSIDEYPSIEVELKMANAYHQSGEIDKARQMVDAILANEKASNTLKTKSSTLRAKL